jgi:hypothetical protein
MFFLDCQDGRRSLTEPSLTDLAVCCKGEIIPIILISLYFLIGGGLAFWLPVRHLKK